MLSDLRRESDELELDPAELASVEERLALLQRLGRKYGETLEEILEFGGRAAARAEELERLLERSSGLEEDISRSETELEEAGDLLREARRAAARRVADEALHHLGELGFNEPALELRVDPSAPGPHGADEVRLLFASHSALHPAPAGQIASGGELSRLVLSLRLATGAGEAPVVAFDEVDAGLGGAAALALGRKLDALAGHRQVLCVTHLPQVAAFADAHFVVERRGNRAAVRRVEAEERLEELTRMLSGLPESERGRRHAEELLALASA